MWIGGERVRLSETIPVYSPATGERNGGKAATKQAFGYESTETTILIVFGVILLLHGVFNHIGIRAVARLNDFSAWYHIGVVEVLVFSLALFSKGGLQPVEYLFQVGQTFSDRPYAIAFTSSMDFYRLCTGHVCSHFFC
jgi:amino acid transporter